MRCYFFIKGGGIITRQMANPPQQVELTFPMPIGGGLAYSPIDTEKVFQSTFWRSAEYDGRVDYLETKRDGDAV